VDLVGWQLSFVGTINRKVLLNDNYLRIVISTQKLKKSNKTKIIAVNAVQLRKKQTIQATPVICF